MVLVTTSYTMLGTSIHSSWGTLSTRSNPLNLFVTSTICSFISSQDQVFSTLYALHLPSKGLGFNNANYSKRMSVFDTCQKELCIGGRVEMMMGWIIGPKGFAGIFFALVSEFPLNCKLLSCVSIPALQLCLSQMISLKSNDELWLVFSAGALTDSFFPTVNILVSLLFSESLIWWGKCPNKDKETVNCFKSCRGKNFQALVGQLLPLVPCILSVAWSWEQTEFWGLCHLNSLLWGTWTYIPTVDVWLLQSLFMDRGCIWGGCFEKLLFSCWVVSDCDPMDCSLQSSSVHGISHARILEWIAISFSRGSSRPRDWTHVTGFGRQILTAEPAGNPLYEILSMRFTPSTTN